MKKTIAIFGGGPASLAMASFIDTGLFDVTIYEQNKTCGRKFLVAGKGGFNLTFSESMDQLKKRYTPSSFLDDALNKFTNEDLRTWLSNLGIDTFVGSSNRVFPIKGIKPIEVLHAILKHIESRGVKIEFRKQWNGWSEAGLPLVNDDIEIDADYYVFAFGGASWKITGSTGTWASHFKTRGIQINDFEPSNCAFGVDWSEAFLASAEGRPLKNIAVRCDSKSKKGELVITRFGLEGNAIYALSECIRKQFKEGGKAQVSIDFKPMFTTDDIKMKLQKSKSKNSTAFLKRDLNLSSVQVQLIKHLTTKDEFLNKERLVELIKGLPITLAGMAPIDEAISSVGGVRRGELTDVFELKKIRDSFCIGEMVDWDAPTGGYLLQGCMSMGVYLAGRLNELALN